MPAAQDPPARNILRKNQKHRYHWQDRVVRVDLAERWPDDRYWRDFNLAACYRMRSIIVTAALLSISNIFMTFAWYAHLKTLGSRPWIVAALVSWGVALFEYLFQVPANRIGYSVLGVGQLKMLQEIITLCVFVPFAILYMREPLKMDYLWAALCIVGAVFFVFRSKWFGS